MAVGSRMGYFTCVTKGANSHVAGEREADIQQAQVFHSLLAARRVELCDRLDAQAIQLAGYERKCNSAGVRRKRIRIKEIGADIRDVDRMMHALRSRLLGSQHGQQSN